LGNQTEDKYATADVDGFDDVSGRVIPLSSSGSTRKKWATTHFLAFAGNKALVLLRELATLGQAREKNSHPGLWSEH
jgi:hypothetical protein